MNANGPELSKEQQPKIDQKEIKKNLETKISLADLKKDILNPQLSKQREQSVIVEKAPVPTKKPTSEVFGDQVNEHALENAVSTLEYSAVTPHKELSVDRVVPNKQEDRIPTLVSHPSLARWLARSDRPAKQEIAQSANTLVTDLTIKESNPLVDGLRRVAEWFFV